MNVFSLSSDNLSISMSYGVVTHKPSIWKSYKMLQQNLLLYNQLLVSIGIDHLCSLDTGSSFFLPNFASELYKLCKHAFFMGIQCVSVAQVCIFNAWTSLLSGIIAGMCVLAGCDFLPSVPGIGMGKAYALVSKYQNLDRVSILSAS